MFIESVVPSAIRTKVFKKGFLVDLCLSLGSSQKQSLGQGLCTGIFLSCDPKEPEKENGKSIRGKRGSQSVKFLITMGN